MRNRKLASPGSDHQEPGEGGEHLGERERDRVVPGSEALHHDDLEREQRGAAEHERVAARRASVDPGEHREADRRERDSRPGRARNAHRKSASAKSGVKTTYVPVMNPVEETELRSSPAVCNA